MQSIRIVTMNPEDLTREFVYECHNPETALGIISGTMEACVNTGWSIKSMEMI